MIVDEFVCIFFRSKKKKEEKVLGSILCPLSPQKHCIAKAGIHFLLT